MLLSDQEFVQRIVAFIKKQIDMHLQAKNSKDLLDQQVHIALADIFIKQRQFFLGFLEDPDNSKYVDLKALEKTMCCFVPIVALANGKYLSGTEIKNVSLKQDKLFVRIGGGFDVFENVLYENA